MHLNINLTSFAAILWSGMLIISGSIWILSSQVRRLVDHMDDQARLPVREVRSTRRASTPSVPRKAVRRSVPRSTSRVN